MRLKLTGELIEPAFMQNEAITHYDRLIGYLRDRTDIGEIKRFANDGVITMKRKYRQRLVKIGDQIGESYFSSGCNYCQAYLSNCGRCELVNVKLREGVVYDGYECCGGLWGKMLFSDNFEKMLKYAIKIRQYIINHG